MLIRRLARPMLAASFVTGGVESLRNPQPRTATADPVAPALAEKLPVSLPSDPEQLVKIDAGVKILGGLLLATNRLPRVASAVLIGSLVPTTWAAHRFWEETDPAKKADQLHHFYKNVGLLGGLLLATVDTEGKPSLRWRVARTSTFVKAKAVDALPIG